MSAYLATLPQGIDSYPDVRAKASLYRSTVEGYTVADPSILPEALQRLLRDPAPVSSWVPEVHSHAMILISRDLRFNSDRAFIDFAYEKQRKLFSGPLYKIMLSLASPAMLLRTAALRWGSFHRGTQFTVEEATGTSARIRVDHPARLWDGLLADAMGAGLKAVLDLSGARDTRLVVTEQGETHLRIHGTWHT